jgi:glycosyltransferase involved in cell wall biosynthesis
MPMTRVFLIHQNSIQHYRVAIYNYLHQYLFRHGFFLYVISEGIQKGNTTKVNFPFLKVNLRFNRLRKLISEYDPQIVILFVNLNNSFLYPILLHLKISRRKIVYWGHGIDLQDKNSFIKRRLYSAEHVLCDALILYADHLKQYVSRRLLNKTFVANNTLFFPNDEAETFDKQAILAQYGIVTDKNIILVGRLQKRKRIEDLVCAFKILSRNDIGLILVGPDEECVAEKAKGQNRNIFSIGPLYGKDLIDLLKACDIYCMPGAMGLSIVDAFHCGLPVITENVSHGPEIMYLRDGVNGFMVDKGDQKALAQRIDLLLEDKKLYTQFSIAAKQEIETNGHIDHMCQGFLECLKYVREINLKR